MLTAGVMSRQGDSDGERERTNFMQYTFRAFKWLSAMDGFGYPVDVYYGSIYLGILETLADGFVIRFVDTPRGKVKIKETPNNKFKSQELAAKMLHQVWKLARMDKL